MTTILPVQMFAGSRHRGDPEKRLMAAVLADAIHAYQRWAQSNRPTGKHFAEIEAWFASDDVEYPFAFVRICDALGLDPGWIRDGLVHWRASTGAPTEPGVPLSKEEAAWLAS